MRKKYFTDEEKRLARQLEAKKYYDKFRKKPLSEEEKEKLKARQKKSREEYLKKYYAENKEKSREYSKKYFKTNQAVKQKKNNERYKKRRLEDPIFKLSTNLKRRIREVIKKNCWVKQSSTKKILGCSFEEFKLHIESKFLPWMNWENHGLYNGTEGYGWDIDHIIPLASVITEDDVIRLNHYTNLQPLCSYINRNVKKDNVNYS